VRWLLLLYPRRWRRRYGDEFLALIQDRGVSSSVIFDVLRGALDAWLHPHLGAAPAPVSAASADHPVRGASDTFTPRTRVVLQLAQAEAQRLQQPRIGTEHLLLGLVAQGSGVAADLLRQRNVADLGALRQQLVRILNRGGPHVRPLT
jgi:hypothetical protein